MKIKQLSIFCIPIFSIGIAGVFPALYLSHLFTTLPFTQLKAWELLQQNFFSIPHFIWASGPVFCIAILSIPFFMNPRSYERITLALYTICSILLFLSPLPAALGLTPARFMSTLVILCISVIAADGIYNTSTVIKTKIFLRLSVNPASPAGRRELYTVLLLLFLSLILLPSHIASMTQAAKFNPYDAYQFLSSSDYRLLQTAGAISTREKDLYLVIWPYNVVFPALTGKNSFNGHSLLTIHAPDKDLRAQHIFDGSMSKEAIQTFLTDNHIRYVIAYTWTTKLPDLAMLVRRASTPSLILYEVVQ